MQSCSQHACSYLHIIYDSPLKSQESQPHSPEAPRFGNLLTAVSWRLSLGGAAPECDVSVVRLYLYLYLYLYSTLPLARHAMSSLVSDSKT